MNIENVISKLQAVSDGEQLQIKNPVGTWQDMRVIPTMSLDSMSNDEMVRIKPKPTPIDLSVLIESGIDCEFSDYDDFKAIAITKLSEINLPVLPYRNVNGASYKYCRPRMNHIHFWNGGECPVPEGLLCKFHRRNLSLIYGVTKLNTSLWQHCDNQVDVIGFEIVGLENGYCWPWEQ